mmetsp:Transcript_12703/g.19055  ORF Transcript_12703/g.19055 Transcript_12703/m.19055 type:complete len:1128 (+) Transcript_12703:51-3434(+)
MEARWLPSTGSEQVVEEVPKVKGWIRARIERYALSNGAPLYFVRAEAQGLGERTLSLKFENFRLLHRRLTEEGGVLYGTCSYFPKAPRKARLGLRMTSTEINEQCEALNIWLRETTESVNQLPLALQREVRIFLALEGAEPPPWTTAKASGTGGLFSSMSAAKRRASGQKKKEESPVYPLGESLPGVTRRGRLECRDTTTGQWLSVHVILTHLSLLVFQPIAAGDASTDNNKAPDVVPDALQFAKKERSYSTDAVSRTAAESLAATAGSANAHPLAAALAEGVGSSSGNKIAVQDQKIVDPKDKVKEEIEKPIAEKNLSIDGTNSMRDRGDPITPRTSSAGRLLYNLHVTDILSLLRHGDTDVLSAPPIHHRCFTIVDLNDTSVCLRAISARDCIQWLKAVARAKDRALAAVHRLDDKSHGHELVLATLVQPGKYAGREESIVARGYHTKGQLYGWFEPLRVRLIRAQLRFELNAGELELSVASLLERAASDFINGLGPAGSQHAAEAAANSGDMSAAAFWARVKPQLDDDLDFQSQRLEILLAVDASRVLADAFALQTKRKSNALIRRVKAVVIAAQSLANDNIFPLLKRALATRTGAIVVAAFTCYLVSTKNNVNIENEMTQPRLILEKRKPALTLAIFQFQFLFALLDDKNYLILALGPIQLVKCCYVLAFFALVIFVLYAQAGEDTIYDKHELTPAATLVEDAFNAANEESAIDVRLVNWRWRDIDRELRRDEKASTVKKTQKGLPTISTETSTIGKWAQRLQQYGVKYFLAGTDTGDKETAEATVEPVIHVEEMGQDETVRDKIFDQELKQEENDQLPADVPARFLGAVRGDHAAALKRWAETVAFRESGNRPDEVLQRPQPYFYRIKALHKHFVHKRDRLGHILAFEVVDSPNRSFKQLANEGITVDDVANHMHFVSAFTYVKILDDVDEVGRKPKDPQGYFLKVIDLRHIGLGDCGGDTARYFKLVAAINRNYPERVWRTIIINAPSVFGVIWTIVSPLLEPNVREKITVLRSNYKDHLRELVDPDDLPVEYGGNDAQTSPEEIALASYVDELNARAGVTSANSPSLENEDKSKSFSDFNVPSTFLAALPTDSSDRGDDSPRTVATEGEDSTRKSLDEFI